jgi:hypothetical protein
MIAVTAVNTRCDLLSFPTPKKDGVFFMLKKPGVKVAAATAALAAVTAFAAPAASATTLNGEWSIAYGTQWAAQIDAQLQCHYWGWNWASNATFTWDEGRNAWRAQVWCS